MKNEEVFWTIVYIMHSLSSQSSNRQWPNNTYCPTVSQVTKQHSLAHSAIIQWLYHVIHKSIYRYMSWLCIQYTDNSFMANIYWSTCVSRHSQLTNGAILLEQNFTAHMPLLTASSIFGLNTPPPYNYTVSVLSCCVCSIRIKSWSCWCEITSSRRGSPSVSAAGYVAKSHSQYHSAHSATEASNNSTTLRMKSTTATTIMHCSHSGGLAYWNSTGCIQLRQRQ